MTNKESAIKTATEILAEFGIKNDDDLYAKAREDLAVVYETLKAGVVEQYDLSDEDMEDILDEILGN